jgi:hypothetical protein
MVATIPPPQPLRTLIAVTLNIIETDGCYIPPPKNGSATSTYTKVLSAFSAGGFPHVDDNYYRLADEIIEFFKELPKSVNYKTIMLQPDSAMFQNCISVAEQTEVMPINIMYVVMMPTLFGKLRPKRIVSEIKIDDAMLTEPGNFMGKKDVPNRFFVKLVAVGVKDIKFGGHRFEILDRNNNVGFFYEKPENLKHVIMLGDCFSMIATPMIHKTNEQGEKQTIFRSINIVENKGPGASVPNPSADITGMFTRT